MNLFDPLRPTINGRPAFACGHVVVPAPSVWPRNDGSVELTMMLPVRGEGAFVSKYYKHTMRANALEDFLQSFILDPEGTLETAFADDPLPPELRSVRSSAPRSVSAPTASLEDLI